MNAGTARRTKRVFDGYLEAFGARAAWKVRTTAVPETTSRISQAYGRGDPVDVDWVKALDDTDVFTSGGTVLLAFDVPTNRQDVSAGQMLSGTTTGYVATENEVKAGDVLVVDGAAWRVDGVRPASEGGGFPAVYRELTLQRMGAA